MGSPGGNVESVAGGSIGTQIDGYKFGYEQKGEDGVKPALGEGARSGGGGYWGGKGGKTNCNACSSTGGAGGSSFISRHTGCIAVNKDGSVADNSIHYSKIRFHDTSTNSGVNLSDGKAVIMSYGIVFKSCPRKRNNNLNLCCFNNDEMSYDETEVALY